jgi:hypothetical protein
LPKNGRAPLNGTIGTWLPKRGIALMIAPQTTKDIALACLIAGFVWVAEWAAIGIASPYRGDGATYLAMASGAEGDAPWSFHILTPRTAGAIAPRNPAHGFFAIAGFSFLVATGSVVLMLSAKPLAMDRRERFLGALLFMSVYPGVAMFRTYYLTDSVSYALLALAIAAAIHQWDIAFAIVTLVGVFNRETALFAAPVWLTLNFGRFRLDKLFLRSILVFSPAVAGYLVLHFTPLFFGHWPVHFDYLSAAGVQELWRYTAHTLGTPNVAYGLAICVFLAYGPMWFLAAHGYWRAISQRDRALPYLLSMGTLAFPTALALNVVDWRRGFQPLFPAMITATILGLRPLSCAGSRMSWPLAAAGTVLATYAVTTAWWSPRISVVVGITMPIWMMLMAALSISTRVRKPVEEPAR